jgi:hypothetical protein
MLEAMQTAFDHSAQKRCFVPEQAASATALGEALNTDAKALATSLQQPSEG